MLWAMNEYANMYALILKLNAETLVSERTREIIKALRQHRNDETYRAIERFLDSDQEMDALSALADIDFPRTLPHLARFLRVGHHNAACLNILHEQKKKLGLAALVSALKNYPAYNHHEFSYRVEKMFRSKKGLENPFREEEMRAILNEMDGPYG